MLKMTAFLTRIVFISHLNRCRLIFVVFSVSTQIFNVNVWQTRNQQLEFLFVEDRDQTLRNNVVESLQKCVESVKEEI